MKNIFLFGAGASIGCGGLSIIPPSGAALFSELKKYYPYSWGKLPGEYDDKFSNNFELGMEELYNKNFPLVPQLMRDLGVYFSQFKINNPTENIYCQLFNKLKAQKIINNTMISTLNYECLIEIAGCITDVKSNYFVPSDQNDISIYKLHGSCNFIPDLHMNRDASLQTPGTVVNCDFNYVQPSEVKIFCEGDTSLFPVMSIFMRGKPNQIAATRFDKIKEAWRGYILQAENVFIIGVNPNLDDTHIWDPLSETKAKIYFCGNKDAFERWQKIKARTDVYLGSKFQNCFSDIIKYL